MTPPSELEKALNLISDPTTATGGRGSKSGSNNEILQSLDQLVHVAEVLQPCDQVPFVTNFVPWALRLLEATPIKMLETSVEHRIRTCVLGILKTITSMSEPMKGFLDELMEAFLRILKEDNEENAVLVIHILIDLHKVHRTALEPYAQPLVDYVLAGFESFPEVCEAVFEVAKREERSQHGTHSRRGTRTEMVGQLLPATSSFKVLIECPVMIVLLFQIHRKLVSENINRFAPQVIKALNVVIEVPVNVTASQNSVAGDLDILAQNHPLAVAFGDYVAVQVKTLSFLAYISRGFASIIRPHFSLIPTNVLRLLRDCPSDCASARKELLVATRHILSTEIRQAFVPFLEDLLNEKLLLGEGYTSFHVLRPLALSMLADLVHHVRAEIKIGLLNRIIHIYTQALHDPSIPVGVQTMSAKLLVNLVDSMLVEELGTFKERRAGLVRILMTLLTKFEWIADWVLDCKSRLDATAAMRQYSQFYADPLRARPIDTDAITIDPNRDNFRDFKFLLKTLIGGVKHVLFALKTLPVQGPSQGPTDSSQEPLMFAVEEGREFLGFLRNGVISFEIFRLADSTGTGPSLLPENVLNVVSLQSEEKEIYEQFAYLFTILDPYLFQEVFTYHMDFLVQSSQANHSLLIIPQYFLAISGISRNFAGLLVRYLMDHFDDLVSEDGTVGAISLRLFKLLFLAISVYPDENEVVLQPHLMDIIMNCLKRQHQHPAGRSLNYFLLLRSLFRSIGGGRFDALYKEVLPLLPVILEELGKLPTTTNDPMLRELYVELCLTTPVRLSVLLPYLSHLMKPLVLALQAGPELVSQGLRTLELCIDNLTQDFLEPIVHPVLGELLDCLWGLLKPPPANQAHSHAAMRILGKMGGRSHRYLFNIKQDAPIASRPTESRNDLIQLSLGFSDCQNIELPIDEVIMSACQVLSPDSKSEPEHKMQAFSAIATAVRVLFSSIRVGETEQEVTIPFQSLSSRLSKLGACKTVSEKISPIFCASVLTSLFWATDNENIGERAKELLLDIYVAIAGVIITPTKACAILPGPETFIDVLIDAYCVEAGQAVIIDIIRELDRVNHDCPDSMVLSLLLEKLIGACYRVGLKERSQVVKLIGEVCQLGLDMPWVWAYEVRLARGLLYIMKSLPIQHGTDTRDTLLQFLRLCNKPGGDKRSSYFTQLLTLLVSELSNSNATVRGAVQACFQLLADLTETDVTALLLPLKDRLLAPIFTKPLRALPPSLQIGYIDAITFCLGLKPVLIEVNDELLRLLNEAIALSEADDSFLASKTNQIQNQANILQLRLGCIRLLSVSLATAEFQLPRLQPLRNMIVAVFFKSLYSRAPEVVEGARAALEQVMVHQNKLPKDLLQTALRPVLTNLAEAKRLTLPGLDGLRRVLELLTSYFKAEIGKKLLDHLAAWADPKKPLQDAASRPLCESIEVKVIAAILDIFHLLPPSGHVFVTELVSVVVNLERLILRSSSSPFRPPLQRLLTRYPDESMEHFFSHIEDPSVMEIYAHVVGMTGSESIIGALVAHVDKLRTALASVSGLVRPHLMIILEQIVLSGKLSAPVASDLIHFIWGQVLKAQGSINDIRGCYRMAKGILVKTPDQFQLCFLLLSIAETSFMAISSNLAGLLQDSMIASVKANNPNLTQMILHAWSTHHSTKERSIWFKVHAIRLLLLPLLGLLHENPTMATLCFTTEIQQSLIQALGQPLSKSVLDPSMLAVEEIQAVTSLIRIDQSFCSDATWQILLNKAVLADPAARFAAYSGLVAWLLASGETEKSPSSNYLHLLPSLLKMPTSETKPVVRQALESLLQATLKTPSTIAQIADILSTQALDKQSHSTVLVAVLWQSLTVLEGADELVVELAPSLMSSFLRFAHSVFLLPDSRGLPFDLLELLVKLKGRLSVSQSVFEGICCLSLKLLLSLSLTADPTHDSSLASRALSILIDFVGAYAQDSQPLPYGCFERILSVEPSDETQSLGQKSALKLLVTLLQSRDRGLLCDLVALGPIVVNAASHASGTDVFTLLGLYFNSMSESQLDPFVERLQTLAFEGVSFGKNLPTSLFTISQVSSMRSDEKVLSALIKLMPKVGRDYLTKHEQVLSSGTSDDQGLALQLNQIVVPTLGILLESSFDAAKAAALVAIQLFWERSYEPKLIAHLLSLFTGWVRREESRPFSVKEISTVLLTPSKLDQIKNESVMSAYLDLLLAIYESSSFIGSELSNRLEGSFLQGLASPSHRARFIKVLDNHLASSLALRLQYILGGIRWNLTGSYDWIPLLINLVLLGLQEHVTVVRPQGRSVLLSETEALSRLTGIDGIESLLEYVRNFVYLDEQMAGRLWFALFPKIWAIVSDSDRSGISKALTKLLASHEKLFALNAGPSNPVYSLLAAASQCNPVPQIPPHLLRFVAQNHKSWYPSLVLLESQLSGGNLMDKDLLQASCSLYRDLSETDMLYGTLKRTCVLAESNAALSFAQTNRWGLAQKIAEHAQEATRTGSLPYHELEVTVWEDIWTEAAQKLQQWDLVTEVSKLDNDTDLNLECIWRLGDWMQPETINIAEGMIRSIPEPTNSRIKFLESFLILNGVREGSAGGGPERHVARFQGALEEAIQGAIQSWNLLPEKVSRSHAGHLHMFQMFVEIQEAMTVYAGIAGGQSNPASMINRPQFLTDLKGLLSTWRERLPNRMDDMNVWSDLLAWRQHVFSVLNSAFQTNTTGTAAGSDQGTTQAHPFAYRGYHELAWLINKFARVCRKNGMPEVCLSFLNRIYTLPNIEIQDAFSKLKEQTQCYIDNPTELPTALEVIQATNLNYFNGIQKAEFFALKGQILSRLGMVEEANRIFAQAVQIDLNIGKGWAFWGQFNDQRFQQTFDITLAVNAINCYLQAATLHKIAKARRFGARILWLLTFEDSQGSMAKSFEMYNNDLPTWFWVAFIPQLLSGLTRKEAKHVRFLLIKLAKAFPQALYLPLRTVSEEFRLQFGPPPTTQAAPAAEEKEGSENGGGGGGGSQGMPPVPPPSMSPLDRRGPTEYTDGLLAILKTGYPLLSLSMENMVEHIVQRLRSTADEDLYRVIVTLLSEAFQQMMIRFNSASDSVSGNGMEASLKRVSQMLGSSQYLANTYKRAFDEDFSNPALTLDQVIDLLHGWKTDLEAMIQRCPTSFTLESLSRLLAEFEFQRYDEVEVPGQYLQLRDNNSDFSKIERFEPIVEIVRRHGSSYRRVVIRASDGTAHRFIVQNPSARQARREEKLIQFFRIIRRSLKESPNARKRGLDFTVPTIVAVSAHVRLIQDDLDQVSLEEVYEAHCRAEGVPSDRTLLFYRDTLQTELTRLGVQLRKGNVEVLNLRVDLFQRITQPDMVPPTILSSFLRSTAPSLDEFWLFRQSFARHYAGSLFLAYVMALGHRYPHKITFSRASGRLINTEVLPTLNPNGQITLVEAVPFRLTPNLQEYMTDLVVEGALTPAIHAYAEVFFRPESELCEFLPMIVRDELIAWVFLNHPHKPRYQPDSDSGQLLFKQDLEMLEQFNIDERQFLGRVIQNCELTMKRCQTMACLKESERALEGKTSAVQTILDLISCATNPQKLALMDAHWHPWF